MVRRMQPPALLPVFATAAAGLVLRIAYLASVSGNPFWRSLGLDMEVYDSWARAILDGRGFGQAPFTQAPFFPMILSLVYGVLGPDPVRALWVHLVPGTAAVFLTSWIALRLRGPAAAWIAGGLLALYKPAIFYTGVLLPPTWVVCLTCLALACVVRAAGKGDEQRAGSALAAGPAGLAFGLLALAQPVALALAAPAAVLLSRSAGRDPRRMVWFALGILLPLAATFVYNGLAGRAWSFVAVNGGINLYIGNGPEANGAYVRPPEMREDRDLLGIEAARRLSGWRDPSRRQDGLATGSIERRDEAEVFGPAEADRFWRNRAVKYSLQNPGRTLRLYLRKLLFFFGQYEIPQIESLPFETKYSWLLRIPLPGMALLTALGIFGAILLYRRDEHVRWLAWSAAALALAASVFFVTARFRLPAAPILAILGGTGLAGMLDLRRSSIPSAGGRAKSLASARKTRGGGIGRRTARRERRGCGGRKELIAAAGVAAAAGIILSLNPAGIDRAAGDGQHHFRTGILLEREGRNPEAVDAYRRALDLDPTLGKAHVNLGTLLARSGDLAAARRHLEQGVALDPLSAIGFVNLGDLCQVQGRAQDALDAYSRALAVEPDHIHALEGVALMLYELGRVPEAAVFLSRVERGAPTGSPPALRSLNLLAILAEREAAGAGEEWTQDADLRRADMLLARLASDEAATLYRKSATSGANVHSRAEAARMLERLSP